MEWGWMEMKMKMAQAEGEIEIEGKGELVIFDGWQLLDLELKDFIKLTRINKLDLSCVFWYVQRNFRRKEEKRDPKVHLWI